MAQRLRCVLLASAATLWLAPAQAAEPRTPQPVIEPARPGTQCIADPATMRRDHPAMLEHQRDQAVRDGIRGAKASLKACIACHASATTKSVAKSETNFCVSCHNYTAVRIDCFGCHATQPKPTAFHPIVPPAPQGAAAARLAAQLKALPSGVIDSATVRRLP